MKFRAWGWRQKVGILSYVGILVMNQIHAQFLQLLAKLPGIWSDNTNGILADPQDTQHAQAIQPTFVDLSQVVVLKLPGTQMQEKTPLTKQSVITLIYLFLW